MLALFYAGCLILSFTDNIDFDTFAVIAIHGDSMYLYVMHDSDTITNDNADMNEKYSNVDSLRKSIPVKFITQKIITP